MSDNRQRRYEKLWDLQGKALENAPKWARFRSNMLEAFPAPFRSASDPLATTVADAVQMMGDLRPAPDGPAYLGTNSALAYDFSTVKQAAIPAKMGDAHDVIRQVVALFEGAPHWGHPLTMCNVIPQPNTVAIIASMLSQVYSPNILEGEYAWNTHRAELETAGMLARANHDRTHKHANPFDPPCRLMYGKVFTVEAAHLEQVL